MRVAIPESKGRTIAEHRAIAHGPASGDMGAAGTVMRAPHRCRAALAHPSAVPGNPRLGGRASSDA